MNVTNDQLVVVRGITDEFFNENFAKFAIQFGGTPQAVPASDAYYVGLYFGAPISKITHIGVVKEIERDNTNAPYAEFEIKTLIKLENPLDPGHAIRKHENWALSDFDLSDKELNMLQAIRNNI